METQPEIQNETLNEALQKARPSLKRGTAYQSTGASEGASAVLYELAGSTDQVLLPSLASQVLPLLNGKSTIPEILSYLLKKNGKVSFKSVFEILQKLQVYGFLEGAEVLVTRDAEKRIEAFDREPLWLSRPIFSQTLWAPQIGASPSPILFYILCFISLILTTAVTAWALFTGQITAPAGFLRLDASYVKGLIFFFLSASVIMTVKSLFKALLSAKLTGLQSPLRLELNLYSLALRSHDNKVYIYGDHFTGSLAFLAVISAYFFTFSIVTMAAAIWPTVSFLINDLFWVSVVLVVVDLNPLRRSDLSSFFNIKFNQRSTPDLLPYLKNRSLLPLTRIGQLTDLRIYIAYSTIALFWMMAAYNILLILITRNDTLILFSFLDTLRSSVFAEALASFILGLALGLSLIYLIYDLLTTFFKNFLFPLKTRLLSQKAKRKSQEERTQDGASLLGIFAAIPLFQGIHRDLLLFLIERSQIQRTPANSPIIIQGTPSQELFILLSGEVLIQKRQASGAVQNITRLKSPTAFGENTVLDQAPRSADVIAATDVELLKIPSFTISELLQKSDNHSSVHELVDRLLLGQYLASSELFQDAPKEIISLFLNEGRLLSLKPGIQVIEQGRTDKDFYLLIRGKVDVVASGQILAELTQGDYFGEMALILNSPRTASVITKESCRLLKLSAESFWKILSEHAGIALYLESTSQDRLLKIDHWRGPT